MGQARKHDWQKIKEFYIQNPNATLRGMGRHLKIGYSKIQKRAKAEKWAEQREEFQADVERRVREKVAVERTELIMSSRRQTSEDMDAVCHEILARVKEGLDPDRPPDVVEEITTVTKETEDGTIVKKTSRAKKPHVDSRFMEKLLATYHRFLLRADQEENSGGGIVREITIE